MEHAARGREDQGCAMRRVATLLVTFLLGSCPAFACTCAKPVGNPTQEELLAHRLGASAAVFLGRVTSVRQPKFRPGDRTGPALLSYKFRVERAWKGSSRGRKVVIRTWSQRSMCGCAFEIGERYLIFAYREGELHTSICDGNLPAGLAGETISVLDSLVRAPSDSTSWEAPKE